MASSSTVPTSGMSLAELVTALAQSCKVRLTDDIHAADALEIALQAARDEADFLATSPNSGVPIETRLQEGEELIRHQYSVVGEQLRAINAREIGSSARALERLHQMSESKLVKIIDFYDKDIERLTSKLSHKGTLFSICAGGLSLT